MPKHKLFWHEAHNYNNSHTIKAICECGWSLERVISAREAVEYGSAPFKLAEKPLKRAYDAHIKVQAEG